MADERILHRLGSSIHYWISGEEKNPVIVFTHGATLDHKSFDGQVASMVAAGYRVVTWDLRGHGKSVPIGSDISISTMADDLSAIIGEVAAKKVVLVGHSFGGFVSQEFVHKYHERVSALIIIGCTNLAGKSTTFNRLLYRIMPRMLNKMPLETFRQRTLADLCINESVKEYATKAMENIPKEDFISITMSGVAALWLDSGFESNYVIPVSFLLTHGDSDKANGGVYPRQSKAWAAKEPNAQYKVIPNAGHTAQMDNPKAFNNILLEFLKS